MSKKDGHCSACGSIQLSDSPRPWGDWCLPCEEKMKLEEPWYVPGMSHQETVQAKAEWELKNKKPKIQLSECPFCGRDQGTSGVHLCVGLGSAPYIVECIGCRGRTGGSQSFEEAAAQWNLRAVASKR
jgi:hypothetical protein